MLLNIEQLTEVVTEVPLPCSRCNGDGYLQQHRHISSGVCFKCDGTGKSLKTKTVKTDKVETSYSVNCEVMEEGDTFESMLERFQKRQDNDAIATEVATNEGGDFNLFDYYDVLIELEKTDNPSTPKAIASSALCHTSIMR